MSNDEGVEERNRDLYMFRKYLKSERLPTMWCPGCGNGIVLRQVCAALAELQFPKTGTVVVSGIGCSGRSAGYFDLDSVHTAHGRAIPVAEGIKAANPKLNVIVLSGDGDLLGIGGNHLIHAARRNTDIAVICVANEIYGMTGGQTSPLTKTGVKTIVNPEGSPDIPINAQALISAHGNFYARSTTYHLNHLRKSVISALMHDGFSFVEARAQCIVNNGRRIGFKNAYEMLTFFKSHYRVNDDAETLRDDEIGIAKIGTQQL